MHLQMMQRTSLRSKWLDQVTGKSTEKILNFFTPSTFNEIIDQLSAYMRLKDNPNIVDLKQEMNVLLLKDREDRANLA